MESATHPEATNEAPETAIDGEGRFAAAGSFDVHRPVDGSVIRTVAIDSEAQVAETVARARAAQPAWEAIGFDGRRRWMEELRDWILDNQDRLDSMMQEETGKVRADATLEAFYCLDAINYWVDQGPKLLADEIVTPHVPLLRAKRSKIVYRPFGVVGLISPWNFPVVLSVGDALPALVAGNAVVIKPSELTPLTVIELARAWREEIGAPEVLRVVNGGAETAGALIDGVDYLQFTGSERTGRIVMKRAAETLTPVSLELGGKDPMIVTRDADLDRAVNATAWGGLVNSGQVCIGIERVYVEEPVYDEFVDKLRAKVKTLRQGADGDTYTAEIGAMTSPPQVEIVSEQVEDARASGARVLIGGKRGDGPGDWYEPTVIADVDQSMKVMREETFGPVIPVMKVADVEQAIEFANDTRYGLGSSVFAGDPAEGERIARRIEAGHCNVNDVLVNYNVLGLPMGGWKSSGIGVRHGAQGIRRFCRTEALTVPRLPQAKSEPIWFPYSARKRGAVRRLYRFLSARGIRNRLGI
ncbi:MAG: aldehyde dehydrogenase [Solirubrobacterales bacterium]|jgi:betaine-aldehyde dehydrogenase|nr:aldehyde dehydrogenase [Solirubrobacterales bacterium]